ncbi:hypothetical protein ABIB73_007647, partial [Bradyrhizobium sp. F1.4.3]|uniref:transposase zinc-binding domain-containing protein n=1 Tax=Bradyrhizobium sp. F1.4.3 TaxID=3156356 RepID=UPI00339298B0
MIRPDSRSNRPAIEIADILRRHGDTYRRVHAGHLGRVERRVMSAIVACRTEALGGHMEACDDCGTTRIAYNSCLMGKFRNGELATRCILGSVDCKRSAAALRLALDAYFGRVARRRGFHWSDNALTAASSAFRSTTLG